MVVKLKSKLVLKELYLRNFKCFKEFTFSPNEQVTKVMGPNGAGKTTLYDGFKWLLFGKNSNDKKDFGIKPLDEFGNIIPKLEIEVAAMIIIDGVEMKLQKIQKEKWTKKRGREERVFEGNTTDYYIDDVPFNQKAFVAKIEEIISEDSFKMITSLLFFPSMHWSKQRDMLFEMSGSITDEEVQAASENLVGFLDMLNGKKFDDFKKMVAKKVKLIKDDLDKIPIRIDEVQRSMPEKPQFEKVDIELTIQEVQEIITQTDASLSEIAEANKEVDRIVSEINRFKIRLNSVEVTEQQKLSSGHNSNKRQLQQCIEDIAAQKRSITRFESEINELNDNITRESDLKDELFKKWHEVNNKQFQEPEQNGSAFVCNCCGQRLPTESIHEKINQMRVNFSNDKKGELNTIQNRGRAKKEHIGKMQSEVQLIQVKIDDCNAKIVELEKNKNHLESLLQHPVPQKTDFNDVPEWVSVNNTIAELEAKIAEKSDSTSLLEFRNEKAAELKALENLLQVYKDIDKAEARKSEIESSEAELSAELLELEQKQFKCEEFIRTKVDLTDNQINSKFKNVRFKLFNKQVNGDEAETCEALVNTNGSWVPFSDANTAGQMNAGLDIVNALCDYFGITAPIFIDHNESVTQLIKSESQIIGLYVSDQVGGITYE